MKEVITSSKNPQLKNISQLLKQKKDRDEQKRFVIEGFRIVKDACIYAPELIRTVYVSEDFDMAQLPCLPKNTDTEVVKTTVFEGISGTVSTQGILAVVEQPEYTLEEILEAGNGEKAKYLILEDIQDPGNLGTMIRTAEAAGITAVIMSKGTADIFNPKVTRATMGSCFRVPFIYAEDFDGVLKSVKSRGVTVYGAYLRGGQNFRDTVFADRCAIMIGNEGNGLTDEAVALADKRVFIPMEGKIESLNAAVAAAILMYSI